MLVFQSTKAKQISHYYLINRLNNVVKINLEPRAVFDEYIAHFVKKMVLVRLYNATSSLWLTKN